MLLNEDVIAQQAGEAEELIARVYRRGQFVESQTPFYFRQTVIGDERANIARFQISTRAELAVDIDGVVGVGHTSRGAYRARTNGVDVDAASPFLLRPGEAQSWSNDLDLTMVNLDVAALTSFVHAGTAGRTRLQFDRVAPVTSAHAEHWRQVAAFVEQTFSTPELFREDLIRSTAIDALFAATLTCFQVGVTGTVAHLSEQSPAALRRAVAFIEDNAQLPIGLTEIAGAAGMSARGLQDLFRRTVGLSPTGFLRRVRLNAARDELAASDSTQASVAGIAHRWGFVQLGRFAAAYRQEFGENPRDTLRRG